jgi:hypothetical protein
MPFSAEYSSGLIDHHCLTANERQAERKVGSRWRALRAEPKCREPGAVFGAGWLIGVTRRGEAPNATLCGWGFPPDCGRQGGCNCSMKNRA